MTLYKPLVEKVIDIWVAPNRRGFFRAFWVNPADLGKERYVGQPVMPTIPRRTVRNVIRDCRMLGYSGRFYLKGKEI